MLDVKVDAVPALLDGGLHQVADLSDGVVSGGDVEDAGDSVVRLDRPGVGRCGVLDAQDRPPDGRIVDRDCRSLIADLNIVLMMRSKRIRGL